MHAQTPETSSFRAMILTDSDSTIEPATTFVRSIAGEDAQLTVVPFACEFHPNGHGLRLEDRLGEAAGGPLDVLMPADGESIDTRSVSDFAEDRHIDLIATATMCEPGGRLDPTCGAGHLALNSPVPVMLLHSHERDVDTFPKVTRLLVLLDGSARAAQALPFTAKLARRLRLPVQFVMVIDPSRVLPPAYAYDPEAAGDVITDLRETAHWALKQAEQRLEREGIAVQSVLLYGPVMTCIQSTIEPGDMILMTTHGTGRAPAGKLGSIAERMVANVTTPLVIIRGKTERDVVGDAYVACPWVEPISRPAATTA
jgi:nucleotide-binding universal stress UspA family protein